MDNCFGQTVKQIKNISGQTVVFSRDNLASGLYFVRLTQDSKIIAVDKFVIADK
ncbi:MAG: T9SS type A sorting domain-containing protein [Bacteroidetes bacterium]|nr:T9SS type A sorting domain-containing protein [Bacteroidota bacterium]